jgi:hypothetical protein
LDPIVKPTKREATIMRRVLLYPPFRLEPTDTGFLIWVCGNLGTRPPVRCSSLEEVLDWVNANTRLPLPSQPSITINL